jgi:hypothetical protein
MNCQVFVFFGPVERTVSTCAANGRVRQTLSKGDGNGYALAKVLR